MKTIYRAANITEAEILRGMLSAAGIDSHISGYYLQGGVGELAAADSVGIQVDEADISTAIAVLKEYDPAISESGEPATVDESPLSFWLVALLVLLFIGAASYFLG